MLKLPLLFLKNRKQSPTKQIVVVKGKEEYVTIPLSYVDDCSPLGFKQVGRNLPINEISDKLPISLW